MLAAPISDSAYFTDFGDLGTGDDDHGTITLSRNIFDWADQNRTTVSSAVAAVSRPEFFTNGVEPSTTVSTMDQLYMNPLLALKVPHHQSSSGARDGNIVAPSNLFPQLPLSGILNGPVSLPPPADLVSGVEAEGRAEN